MIQTLEQQVFSYSDPGPRAIAALQDALVSAIKRGREVLIDLDRLPELDNAALRGLILLVRRAREAGGSLVVRTTRPELRDTLQVTALDRIVEVA
jgi:anti-anti-sigma factor